jgi:hypothetical protein
VREQQPERDAELEEVPDQIEQQPRSARGVFRVLERRVGDDRRAGRPIGVDRKCVLAGADVALPDAAQAERFKMPDQIAVAGTRLGKGTYTAQVRDERRDSSPWRRVEVSLAALEV